MVSFSLLGLQHPEPNGSRRATPTSTFQHRPGHLRLLYELYGIGDTYVYVVLVLWEFSPLDGVIQTAALVVAWLHGCIGLHFWLRIKPWYPRLLPYAYAAALMLPMLALLGFARAGQTLAVLAQDPVWVDGVIAGLPFPNAAQVDHAYVLRNSSFAIYAVLIFSVVVARLVRAGWERRRGVYHLSYSGGRRVRLTSGMTILEASRTAGIPHAEVCGGRGRCSTCRVRIGSGYDSLAPPDANEQRVLERVGAPPRVRLACQTRPARDLEVTPLLPPTATPRDSRARPDNIQGSEQEIAILFADLRAFTRLAESKLPYDVVFLLNRYFRAMGEAVEGAGGQIDKFIGDGVMALFGVGSGPDQGCREALAGARAMAKQLQELNATLRSDLKEPLRMGIGIHAGSAIVGEMGHADAISMTAIGDAVNTASRLEALTKEHSCQLIVSELVVEHAGLDLSSYPSHQIEVRGRREPLTIRVIADASKLPEAGTEE